MEHIPVVGDDRIQPIGSLFKKRKNYIKNVMLQRFTYMFPFELDFDYFEYEFE